MRIPRIYIGEALNVGENITLNTKASHYLTTVLRMEAERELVAFCGDNQEYQCRITHAHKKNTVLLIESAATIDRESPLNTHLAIGLSRGERFDLVLQKATELGITEITPLYTERTEVKLKGERLAKKMEHWQNIIISACEQCQRNTLPKLNPLVDFNAFINCHDNSLKLVLHHRSDKSLHQHPAPKNVTLLIGPEGGLTPTEIESATTANYHALTLGPRILRTETAPIAALSALQFTWGDF